MRTLKTLIMIAATVSMLNACSNASQPTSAVKGVNDHHDANHCEVFVDKVKATRGSHGSSTLHFYLKTLNARLDGSVAEVGFRANEKTRSYGEFEYDESGWRDVRANRFQGVNDYWEIAVSAGSDYANTTHEGTFYVRTTTGTTYWLKPAPSTNYRVERSLFSSVWEVHGDYNRSQDTMISTQHTPWLGHFNPKTCY